MPFRKDQQKNRKDEHEGSSWYLIPLRNEISQWDFIHLAESQGERLLFPKGNRVISSKKYQQEGSSWDLIPIRTQFPNGILYIWLTLKGKINTSQGEQVHPFGDPLLESLEDLRIFTVGSHLSRAPIPLVVSVVIISQARSSERYCSDVSPSSRKEYFVAFSDATHFSSFTSQCIITVTFVVSWF